MKILIGQSYFRVLDPKELQRNMPYPPLGTLYAATILKSMGHDILFFDAMLSESPDHFNKLIQNVKPDLVLIYDDEFNYLTKMCLSNMRDAALSFIRTANQVKIPIIIYSSDATDQSEIYLSYGCDVIIVGEGERTLQELINSLETGRFEGVKEEIDGLRYLRNEELLSTSKRELVKNLDEFPDPDYDLVDLSIYKKIWNNTHGYFSLNVSTTRGCPYHCNWCAKPIYGQVYNSRSPRKVAVQIQKLNTKYGVEHIWFTDDIFGLKPDWIHEFANVCTEINLKIPYKCLTRPDLFLRGNTLNDLKKSGCKTIWVGAESGSQNILDAMEKGTRVSQIYETAERAQKSGIEVAFFVQFGYIGETWKDILMTRKMIRECMPDDIGISVSYPLPGTKFYDRVRRQMTGKTNWKDSDDLDMMFTGTYEKAFYKILHRLVHAEYRFIRIIKHVQWTKLPQVFISLFKFFYYRLRLTPYLKKVSVPPLQPLLKITK